MTISIGRGDISLSRYVTTIKAIFIVLNLNGSRVPKQRTNMADESGASKQPELQESPSPEG